MSFNFVVSILYMQLSRTRLL